MSDINSEDIIFIKKNLKSIASHLQNIERSATEAKRIANENAQKVAQIEARFNAVVQDVNVLKIKSMGNGPIGN